MSPDTTLSGALTHTWCMNKPINWFEIPALEIARAKAFYESVFGISMQETTMGPMQLAVFPYDRATATGGCLQQGPDCQPSRDGAVLYLNAGDSLDAVLARVEPAGGRILLARTELPPGMGAFAHIADTEGNRVGVHGTA